jgi:hypothetical protein
MPMLFPYDPRSAVPFVGVYRGVLKFRTPTIIPLTRRVGLKIDEKMVHHVSREQVSIQLTTENIPTWNTNVKPAHSLNGWPRSSGCRRRRRRRLQSSSGSWRFDVVGLRGYLGWRWQVGGAASTEPYRVRIRVRPV